MSHACRARTISCILGCLFAALLNLSAHSSDSAAVDIAKLGTGFPYTQCACSLGWQFTAKVDISVTQMGYYDDGSDTTDNHDAGIYDAVTKQLLVSATILPSDTLDGSFRYHILSTPVTLPAGRLYYAMATTNTGHYAVNPNWLSLHPSMAYMGTCGDETGPSATLRYPTGTAAPNNFHGDFGAGFKIADAPVPATAAVEFSSLADPFGASGTDVGPPNPTYSMGYLFRPKRNIFVSSLGYYDDLQNGLLQTHNVAIFDAITTSLVATTNVTKDDPLRGFFRYHAIPAIQLNAGTDYFIMADNTGDKFAQNVDILNINSFVTLKGGAFNNSPPTLGAAFPTQSDANTPFFGPTFEISTSVTGQPVFASPPSASPSVAGVGQVITFSATATGGTGTLTYAWNFGDGSSASGASVTHSYTAALNYVATVTITDGVAQQITANVPVTVNAPLVGYGNDSDGDGFSDNFETAAGTSPNDPASTPTGQIASTGAIMPLTISKALIALNFKKPAKDSIIFVGTLHLNAGFNPNGLKIVVDVSGVDKTFTLDSKGTQKIGKDSFKLSFKSKKGVVADQTAKYTVAFQNGTFLLMLANSGLTNGNVKPSVPVKVQFTIIYGTNIAQKLQTMTYSAKKDVAGKAK